MDEFYKVDLHIHTPASTCYKGTKNNLPTKDPIINRAIRIHDLKVWSIKE